jgi:hypothetical protein
VSSGFRVSDVRFRVKGLIFWVLGLGFGSESLGLWV